MTAIPLIVDCDPGVDDAVALLLAFAAPERLELLAVTTVGGNVPARLTARNARIIRQIAGRQAVPVYAGAEQPLVRAAEAASHFHGESGLGWMEPFEPDVPTAAGHAALAIVETVMARPAGTVTVAAMGPMTNLALAMRLEPAVVDRLAQVVVMGGARREGGNITASAEYNIFADPHSAQIVFSSGLPAVVLGLDATHQVRTTPERLAAIKALDRPAARIVAQLLEFSQDVERRLVGPEPPPLHDPCTIAWLLAPELFTAVPVGLSVETSSPLTLGHTAVEFRGTDPGGSAIRWVTKVDADGVYALLLEHLRG
ncbi:MAG: nucleoside hydrolase [Proteobacteria bacterium]|nr:nucleoside hydrolase [Pseudomonadota bacterium]